MGILKEHWRECTLAQPLWRMTQQYLAKWKMPEAQDPAMPPLGTFSREMLIQEPRDTCSRVCRAILSVMKTSLKESRFPSTRGKVNKCWYIHTIED